MAGPLILVEAQPRSVSDGAPQTVRLAGGGGALPYHYAGAHWRAGIEALPTIIASLDYEEEISGGGVAQAMTLSFAPNGHAAVDDLSRHFWPDAAITVRIGPEGALPPIVASGKVLEMASAEGKMSIALADPAADIKKPLLTDRYAGTGGLEGPAAWDGILKRRVWGRVWNLQAEPIDPANNVYALADPLRPLQAINAVRDRGAPAAALTELAWQGTAAATLAALQGASAPAGGGVVCPSIACLKWWTQPSGDLHADVQGEIGAGYVETTAQIAERLVQALGGPAFAAGTVAAAAALRPAPIGWVAKDESTTVAAMLDDLMASNSLLWLLDPTGAIIIRPWAWGASAASAVSQDVIRQRMIRPVATRRLGYRRNESRMARGDLVAIVLASEVAYLDGTPISDLQPAEAGATSGAPSGTNVGDISADDVSSTIADGGGVAENQVNTAAIVDNAVTESNFALLDLFGASVGTDDDNVWRNFAYAGVALATTFTRPEGATDTTAVFLVTVVGARTGGDNDRVSLRMRRGDGTILLPSEHSYLLFEGGGNTAYTVPFFDAAPLDGTNSYTVQTKNVVGHPVWERGIVIPVRLSK
ncbi:hypothetical protein ACFOKF_15320 [Sphingobium rhizovicinum]|uniref:Tip attachment protein J domain-containing protein n=1 Tax=Sphingobium rhizovicinum TaxID=432308 RepID=A0ABV7NGA9_9SPHN